MPKVNTSELGGSEKEKSWDTVQFAFSPLPLFPQSAIAPHPGPLDWFITTNSGLGVGPYGSPLGAPAVTGHDYMVSIPRPSPKRREEALCLSSAPLAIPLKATDLFFRFLRRGPL